VGPDGQPAVIKQTRTTFIGAYSGGDGNVYVQPYESQTRTIVSTGERTTGVTNRSVQPFQASSFVGQSERDKEFRGTPFQRLGKAFGAGFRAGEPAGVTFGTAIQPTTQQESLFIRTPTQRAAFQLGKASGFFGEPTAAATVAGPVIRGAGIATGAARASRLGSLPVIRTALRTGIGGGAIRGLAYTLAVASGARAIERQRIESFGRQTGITGLNSAVDVAQARYSAGSGLGRRFFEDTFGSFVDTNRFRGEIQSELVARGVSPSQASFAAERVVSQRVSGRARSDILLGIGAEVTGETVGRLARGRLGRAVATNQFFNRLSPRAREVTLRGASSAFGGSFEGALQVAGGGIQSQGRVSPRDVAVGAAGGALFAGFAGGTLGFLGTSPRRLVRGAGTVYEGALDIVDPLERPGDVATDTFFRGYAGRVNRVSVPSFGGGGSRSVRPSSSRTREAIVPSFVSNGRVSTPVPSTQSFNALVPSFTRTPPRSSVPSRNLVPSFVQTPTQIMVPTRTNVPTRFSVPTRTPLPTRTNVPTRVTTPPIALPFFIPPFGGGAGRRGSGRSRSSSRVAAYASSLTAGILRIRQRKGEKRSEGFTGVELRGLSA
jgi:hypothetical protein